MSYAKRKYYVNSAVDADRDVHHEDCTSLPEPDNRKYLGEFYSCIVAVVTAVRMYPTANGCKICSPECHIE
ncbi:hypothetical protein ACFOET_17705 [Parapedobacter deserti]|uniref:Uncharacterized protein n=1 Tax=Parapedobacter deserti TaxID=1912957 RepID=A0ABV7JQS0_9SPHI